MTTLPLWMPVPILVEIIFFLAATVFSMVTVRALISLRWAQRLPHAVYLKNVPKVTVIIAARNEAERIQTTVRHLLDQQGVDLEIIAVDDRSSDETGAILKRLSAEDHRVQARRIETLPDGWLGKCHACHIGAGSATGEWILFTDADCWLKPDTIARALSVAARERVEHVTLTPGVVPTTIPAQAWHIAFLISAADWLARTNKDHPRGYLGVGAFNLLRADTYRKSGGHEALKLTVVDDVKLGKLVRKCGARTRAFIGGDDAECHWGVTVRQMIAIMEKNYFAVLDYRTAAGLSIGIGAIVLWAAAIAGPFTGTFTGIAAGGALFSTIIPGLVLTKRLQWKPYGALFTPLVFGALFYSVLRSTIVTLRQGGIRWRDTFYPLDKLRAGNVY